MKILEINNLYKSFDEKEVLNDINLDVYESEVLAIIGLTYKDTPIVDKKLGVEDAIKTAIEAIKILEERK